MATIAFLTGGGSFQINNLAGSGLGFFNAGFGNSIPVGSFNARTFITDSTGALQGPESWNNQFLAPSSVIIGNVGSGIALTAVPNYQSTLNIQFTHNVAVKTQNAKVQVYDRSNILNPPSGVTTKLCYYVHPGTTQTNTGSGSTVWTHASGVASATGVALLLPGGPGTSGFSPNGVNTTDTEHDWYIGVSQSPDSIGAKTSALYIYLEYL